MSVWMFGFQTNTGTDYGGLMAASTIFALPVVIFFLLVQKRIVSGLTAGAVKWMSTGFARLSRSNRATAAEVELSVRKMARFHARHGTTARALGAQRQPDDSGGAAGGSPGTGK